MNSINRLRTWLNNMDIEYENDDWFFDSFQIERVKIPSCEDCKLSIIQGYGTYGNDKDLLEVWNMDEEEPVGNIDLHEVVSMITKIL